MAVSLVVRLLILWAVLQVCWTTVTVDYPPILEGQSTTLTCAGNLSSTQRRSVHWHTVNPDRTEISQAACHSTIRTCSKPDDRYVPTAQFSSQDYNTSLTILRISQKERYVIFQCISFNKEKGRSDVIQSWNMSKIMYPPDNLVCTARYITDDASMEVVCSTPKVYPSIVCEFSQIYEGTLFPIESSNLSNSYGPSNHTGYVSASCSFVKRVFQPGTYKYQVKIFPGVNVSDLVNEAAKDIFTNEVYVAGPHPIPNIRVDQLSRTICAEQNRTLRFLCTTSWLPSPASIVWSINNTIVSHIEATDTSFESGFYKSKSFIKLSRTSSNPGSQIKCEAHYNIKGTAENKTVSGTRYMDIISPSPHPPSFTYNGIPTSKRTIIIPAGEVNAKVTCLIHGGSPTVYAVRVKCQTANVTIELKRDGMNLSFDLNYTTVSDRGVCSCSALHESGCYNSTANFTFFIQPGEDTRSSLPLQWSHDSKLNIYFITAGFLALIVIILLLGTIIFIVKRWEDLYTYVCDKLYSSVNHERTGAKKSCDSHLYASVDSVITPHLSVADSEGQTFVNNVVVSDDNTTPKSLLVVSTNARHVYSNVIVENDAEYMEPLTSRSTSRRLTITSAASRTNRPGTLGGIPFSQRYLKTCSSSENFDKERSAKSRRHLSVSETTRERPTSNGHSTYENIKTRTSPRPCKIHKLSNLEITLDVPLCKDVLDTPTPNISLLTDGYIQPI